MRAVREPEAAKRFVLATMRAVRDYYKAVNQNLGGRDDIFRILARDTSLKDLALYEKLGLPVYAPNGEFNEAIIGEFQDFLIKAGVQQQRVPTEQWFDRSYMDYALSVLGRYSAGPRVLGGGYTG